jgi:hypothetical protein
MVQNLLGLDGKIPSIKYPGGKMFFSRMHPECAEAKKNGLAAWNHFVCNDRVNRLREARTMNYW